MRALDRYLQNLNVFAYASPEDHLSLDPDYVARVLNPKPPSEWEIRQASYSAKALEDERAMAAAADEEAAREELLAREAAALRRKRETP